MGKARLKSKQEWKDTVAQAREYKQRTGLWPRADLNRSEPVLNPSLEADPFTQELRALLWEAPADANERPIGEIMQEIAASIPEGELDRLPRDYAQNYEHYLYGLPKEQE